MKKMIKQVSKVPGFREVWFDPTAISNIYGLPNMVQISCYVTMDTRVNNGFGIPVKDSSKKSILVDCQEIYIKDKVPVNFCVNLDIDEVEEYTPRQVQRSRQCVKLSHCLQAPSAVELEALISQNFV